MRQCEDSKMKKTNVTKKEGGRKRERLTLWEKMSAIIYSMSGSECDRLFAMQYLLALMNTNFCVILPPSATVIWKGHEIAAPLLYNAASTMRFL